MHTSTLRTSLFTLGLFMSPCTPFHNVQPQQHLTFFQYLCQSLIVLFLFSTSLYLLSFLLPLLSSSSSILFVLLFLPPPLVPVFNNSSSALLPPEAKLPLSQAKTINQSLVSLPLFLASIPHLSLLPPLFISPVSIFLCSATTFYSLLPLCSPLPFFFSVTPQFLFLPSPFSSHTISLLLLRNEHSPFQYFEVFSLYSFSSSDLPVDT